MGASNLKLIFVISSEVVNRVGIYSTKKAEGCSAFQRQSCIFLVEKNILTPIIILCLITIWGMDDNSWVCLHSCISCNTVPRLPHHQHLRITLLTDMLAT